MTVYYKVNQHLTMSTKSLNSSVIKWPDAESVRQALQTWAQWLAKSHPHILRIGYFGSYARGDWGGGSDLDVVVVISATNQSFEQRAAHWDTSALPVPVDLLVYTLAEWQNGVRQGQLSRIANETHWAYDRESSDTLTK